MAFATNSAKLAENDINRQPAPSKTGKTQPTDFCSNYPVHLYRINIPALLPDIKTFRPSIPANNFFICSNLFFRLMIAPFIKLKCGDNPVLAS
jgi:hypothetical protein